MQNQTQVIPENEIPKEDLKTIVSTILGVPVMPVPENEVSEEDTILVYGLYTLAKVKESILAKNREWPGMYISIGNLKNTYKLPE